MVASSSSLSFSHARNETFFFGGGAAINAAITQLESFLGLERSAPKGFTILSAHFIAS